MAKVRFLTRACGRTPDEFWEAGETYDLPAELVDLLVKQGTACPPGEYEKRHDEREAKG
jgi:hypothetical protein